MSKIIPVMVHHETGEKAQAAGKKNQEYLKYCIAQAKKYIEKGIDASIKFCISTYIWQFYSLQAIIMIRQKEDISKLKSVFDTVFNMLKMLGVKPLKIPVVALGVRTVAPHIVLCDSTSVNRSTLVWIGARLT